MQGEQINLISDAAAHDPVPTFYSASVDITDRAVHDFFTGLDDQQVYMYRAVHELSGREY